MFYLQIKTSSHFWNFGLGWPRRPDLRSSSPPKVRSLNSFEVLSSVLTSKNASFYDFYTPNSIYEVTAWRLQRPVSCRPWPSSCISRDHMQSSNLSSFESLDLYNSQRCTYISRIWITLIIECGTDEGTEVIITKAGHHFVVADTWTRFFELPRNLTVVLSL